MTLENFARTIYEYIFERIYDKKASFTRHREFTALYKECVEEIVKENSSAGAEYIWFYIIFQFGRFQKNQFILKGYVKEVMPTNVFGKTSLVRFKQRRKELDDLTIRSPFLATYKISKDDFTHKTRIPFNVERKQVSQRRAARLLKSFIDPIKGSAVKHQDLVDPLTVCLDMTDLFNPQDPSCLKCKSQAECKLQLQKIYPHLYKLKGV